MKIAIFFFIIICVITNCSYASETNYVDSLNALIIKDKNDTNKINHYNEIALEYSFYNTDSAIIYSKLALKLSNELLKKKYYSTDNFLIYLKLTKTCYQLANFYDDNGSYIKSKQLNDIGIKICELLEQTSLNIKMILSQKAKFYSNNGNLLNKTGDYNNALENYFKAIKFASKIDNKKILATNYGNIGIIYKYLGNYYKAIEYYNKALKIAEQLNNKNKICAILSNIANIYDAKNDTVNAFKFYNKSLKISKEINDKRNIETIYINLGDLFQKQKKYEYSLNYYNKSLEIANELGDIVNIIVINGNIGTLYLERNEFSKAENYLLLAINNADKIGYLQASKEFKEKLSELYEKNGKLNLAIKYFKESITAKDSLFNDDKKNEITRKEMTFEFEKKQEKIKAEQDKKDAVTLANKNRQRIILIFVLCVLLLVITIAVIIYRALRVTKKQKTIIEEQKQIVDEKNSELNSRNEEILAQRDEIEAQRETLYIQKNELEKVYEGLRSSIRYAKQIQTALLPTADSLKELFVNHFIFYKPCQIVSGDFYWAKKRNNWLLFCVADCTGHGVPGGFMSMLGISFLNEIVPKENITDSSKTLEELRKYIIRSLNQKGVFGEQKDGMDISFCALNLETNELSFSGANNPLYIVRKNENSVIEISADKMPISIHIKMDNFTNNIVKLNKGDRLYLFSDGYADQFGENSKKKYKYSKFKDLILNISNLSFNEQLSYVEKDFSSWKGNLNQIDDVTILGIEI